MDWKMKLVEKAHADYIDTLCFLFVCFVLRHRYIFWIKTI